MAFSPDSVAKSGTGVEAGDVDGNGHPSFAVTNFNDQYHSLFIDAPVTSHLAALIRFDVVWGTHFLGYDNNGILDLITVNGHINPIINLTRVNVTYLEFALLLQDKGTGVLESVMRKAGPALAKRYPARGVAPGDFDNDGDTNVGFVCLNKGPVLLRKNAGHLSNWIGV